MLGKQGLVQALAPACLYLMLIFDPNAISGGVAVTRYAVLEADLSCPVTAFCVESDPSAPALFG